LAEKQQPIFYAEQNKRLTRGKQLKNQSAKIKITEALRAKSIESRISDLSGIVPMSSIGTKTEAIANEEAKQGSTI